MNVIKIIIVDDHEIVREGLKILLLGTSVEVIADVGSGKSLLDLLKEANPDVILLDLAMPGISGLEILHILYKHHKNIKTLVLSANDGDEYIVKSIEAGANGFLPKDCSKEELVKAIETVKAGEPYFGSSVAQHVFSEFVKRVRYPGEQNRLTERELEVLRYFAEGLNYADTAEKMNISRRTVESHKQTLYDKLGFKSNTDLVKYAIKNNIIKL